MPMQEHCCHHATARRQQICSIKLITNPKYIVFCILVENPTIMKTLTRNLLIVLTLFFSGSAFAQNAEMDAMMKAWTDYMTPGKEHKELGTSVGNWKASLKMWMDPTQAPTEMESRVSNEMILGGRYLVSKYKGEMMGMPFEGISTLGFDNATKKYVSSWIDNMGTGLMYMEGMWNDAVKGIEFKGMGVDPVSGKEVPMRQVFMIKDDKTQVMEMYDSKTGKELKTMEIVLKRM